MGTEDYDDGWNDGHEEGYEAGALDGALNAPMFNDYLAAMVRDAQFIFKIDWNELTLEERKAQLLTHAYAAIEEITEVMGELQWKSWKEGDGRLLKPGSTVEKVAAEGADVLHFVAHILNNVGVTDEMLNREMEKARVKNLERQSAGYSYVGAKTDHA